MQAVRRGDVVYVLAPNGVQYEKRGRRAVEARYVSLTFDGEKYVPHFHRDAQAAHRTAERGLVTEVK